MFNDDDGNIVIMGEELHTDFTGNLRNYLVIAKIDISGKQIWKTYHDVAYETFSPPLNYYFGKMFYTEENGQKLISVVLSIGYQKMLYKIDDDSGEFYSFIEIGSSLFTVDRDNVQAYANVQCSYQPACYGPDSLIVQKINPAPVIGFDPVVWTFGLKQNIRTTPIQGHYDFNNQDITTDAEGNVYLLTQIERWDFQFCTDCGDIFIDAYLEIFKIDTAGQLVKHSKLKTAKAVISNMRFIPNTDGNLVVKIDDINAAGTDIMTSLYILNNDLTLIDQIDLDRQYNSLILDSTLNIFTCTNVYDEADPNIKGMSDVLVSKFNSEGVFQWKSYFGGSSFEYPKGLVLTDDGGLVFFANTESNDFDIVENNGGQDMWLVKLTENGTTGVEDHPSSPSFMIYPNPSSDFINVIEFSGNLDLSLYDLQGRKMIEQKINPINSRIYLQSLQAGVYLVKGVNEARQVFSAKIIKL